ncbi:MAG: hypothetical protein ACYC3L_00745 [Gemmatimonadaceae bacterium]
MTIAILTASILASCAVGALAGYLLGHRDARAQFAREVRRRRDIIEVARGPDGRFQRGPR